SESSRDDRRRWWQMRLLPWIFQRRFRLLQLRDLSYLSVAFVRYYFLKNYLFIYFFIAHLCWMLRRMSSTLPNRFLSSRYPTTLQKLSTFFRVPLSPIIIIALFALVKATLVLFPSAMNAAASEFVFVVTMIKTSRSDPCAESMGANCRRYVKFQVFTSTVGKAILS
ncbi:hypothetical protein PFISCL1PPCAC_19856, partial [Pristionchus fissidentatus]